MLEQRRSPQNPPVPDKYKGVLVCPECGQDYPRLANYQAKMDPNDPLAQHKGYNRFAKFSCDNCGILIKKALPISLYYLMVLFLVVSFFPLVDGYTLWMGNEPFGLGINQFYTRQYLDQFGWLMLPFLSFLILILLMQFLERRFQYLRKHDSRYKTEVILHSVIHGAAAFAVVGLMGLAMFLSLVKNRVNWSSPPNFEKHVSMVLQWSPILKESFFIMQGQGHLLNGRFEQAIENFDSGIEGLKNHSFPFLYRGIAHLYSGNYDQAESDLNMALTLNNGKWEPKDHDIKLWIFLARERKNGSGRDYVRKFQEELNPKRLSDALLLMLSGEKDSKDIKKRFRGKGAVAECQINFFYGVFLNMKGEPEKARIEFDRVHNSETSRCFEAHAAGFELAALDGSTHKEPSKGEAL